jgi:hypothetical protein
MPENQLKLKIIKTIKKTAFFLLFFCNGLFSQSLIKIQGIVIDISGKKIESAHLVVKNVSKNIIIGFTRSNVDGFYEIKTSSITNKNLSLTISCLGFEKQTQLLTFKDSLQTNFQYDFVLNPKSYVLEEVVVKERKSITVKKDTISFNADSFRDNTERVAEDLLKKIPGIDVSSEGKISVNGVGIDRIMIDGDDIVDKNYTLLSKNLPSNLIKDVQILNDFSKNPLLKKVKKSEKIALNLTLKNKEVFFGEATLNYGNQQFNDKKLNLFSFNKKNKTYLLGSANNIGKDILGNLDGLNNNEKDHLKYPLLQTISNSTDLPNPNIDGANTNLNNVKLGSINDIYKFSDKTNIKINAFFNTDTKSAFQQNNTSYFLPALLEIQENLTIQRSPSTYFGQIEVNSNPNQSTQIKFSSKYRKINENSNNDLAFNKTPIEERLYNSSFVFENALGYTHKINEKHLLDLEILHSQQDYSQNYDLTNNLFDGFINKERYLSFLQQNNYTKQSYFGLSINYYGTINKLRYSLLSSMEYQKNFLLSDLKNGLSKDSLASVTSSFSNLLNIESIKYSEKVELKRFIGKWEIQNQIGFDYWNVSRNENSAKMAVTLFENFQAERDFGVHSHFKVKYSYENRLPDSKNLYSNYILTSYRILSQGTEQIDIIGKNQFTVSYNYNDWTDKQLSISSIFSYTNQPINYNNNQNILPKFSISNLEIGNGTETYFYFLNLRKFIPFLTSALKFNTSILKSLSENKINNNEIRYNTFTSQEYKISLKSAFKGFLNFDSGIIYQNYINQTNVKSYENSFENNRLNIYAQLFLKFGKKVNGTIKADHYEMKNIQNIDFYSFSLFYQAIENKLSFTLSGENLGFNKQISIINQSDYFVGMINYRLLQGFVLTGLTYKF